MQSQPQRIGPYFIVRRLGAGGMAETYVAERRGPGDFVQRVCLKRIRADRAEDPELARQFMAEAAITARLRHAALAQVLDFGEHEGELYLAMELVEGLDLRELLRHGPLPESVVLYLSVELCTALDFAHRAPFGPVVHRDVSPSNVLVSREGEVKLADFGIARSLATSPHTNTGIIRGKVPYLAPEYARTGRVDARGDVFSLGVLLYECLCGTRPYDGATDLETLERAARGQRVPVREHAPSTSEDFASLVEQLVEPAVELRFQTASALLEALLSLPSSPRARRELAALVDRHAPAARDELAGEGAASDAETARAGNTAPAPPSEAPTRTRVLEGDVPDAVAPHRRTGTPALALAAASLLALGALWTLRGTPSAEPLPSAARPLPLDNPERAAARVVQPAAAALEARALQPAAEAAPSTAPTQSAVDDSAAVVPLANAAEPESTLPPEAERTKLGSVSISIMPHVLPYGDIVIDGIARGRAPQTLWLTPGKHIVRVEGPGQARTRRVSLRAGQHMLVKFE